MIISRLDGGLGNQLFQYAAGKALAEHHGVELKLDNRVFKNNKLRKYELSHFAVTAPIATSNEINSFTFNNHTVYVRFLKKIFQKIKPHYLRTVYKEPHFHFDNNFFKSPANSYLSGYWQSERFFRGIATIIKKEFQVIHALKDKNAKLAEKIRNSESVCLHIRRGDYVSNTQTQNFHGVCGLNYYIEAIKRIKKKTKAPHFFVFSDDMTWAKANLKIADPTTFVGHNSADTAYEDFRLMVLCKNQIIANSSFSWWSAWLSDYRTKVVLVPAKWFNTSKHDIKDLIPQGWHKI